MNIKRLSLCLVIIFLTSCANKSAKTSSATEDGRLTKLSRQARHNQNQLESKKINQFVKLEKAKSWNRAKKTYALPNPRTEESLYSEVLLSYQSRDLDRIDYFAQQFVYFYPNSVYADNAIYLRGQLNLAMGLPSEALRDFENLIKDYPMGNKRSSALFGKGVAYRKLELFKYAEKVFGQVKKEYPGSPEFFKVDLEMKLLKLEKGV